VAENGAPVAVGCVNVSSSLEETMEIRQLTVPNSNHERRSPEVVAQLQVRTVLREQFDHLRVTVQGCT
jgi:hypothetical protein